MSLIKEAAAAANISYASSDDQQEYNTTGVNAYAIYEEKPDITLYFVSADDFQIWKRRTGALVLANGPYVSAKAPNIPANLVNASTYYMLQGKIILCKIRPLPVQQQTNVKSFDIPPATEADIVADSVDSAKESFRKRFPD